MNNISILLAVLPFLVFLFLLLFKKTSLFKASIVTLFLYTILAIFYWQIFPFYLYVSYGKGFLVAFDILFIIIGAIFFLEVLKDLKVIKNISYYLGSLSKDYRVQIIIIAWFLEAFIEGTAGFGTPAAIAVPLLIGLGLSPIKALVVGLMGNSAPGVFGAAGTPIKVGFAGLNTTAVPAIASLLNCVGFIVPIFMLWLITRGRANKKKEFLNALPFAIWSGVAFVVPSLLFVSLGQEFPTILGSIVGTLLMVFSIKTGFLMPKETLSLVEEKEEKETASMSPFKAFLPYIILVVLLILGKFIIGKIGIIIPFGINHTFNLFNPGFVFIISGLLVVLIFKEKWQIIFRSIKKSFNNAISPFLIVFFMSAMVQLMINTGNNTSSLVSAITIIADSLETNLFPLFVPFIGAFGSFLTGSVTISNIMFGHLFNIAATNLSMDFSVILSLGVVGAATGNMIALADILTAEAVAGVKNAEVSILKGVIVPCAVCLLIVGIIGFIIIK